MTNPKKAKCPWQICLKYLDDLFADQRQKYSVATDPRARVYYTGCLDSILTAKAIVHKHMPKAKAKRGKSE